MAFGALYSTFWQIGIQVKRITECDYPILIIIDLLSFSLYVVRSTVSILAKS